LKNGREITGWADERYRGGPENPLSDADLESKVRSCCDGILENTDQTALIDSAWSILRLPNVSRFMEIINKLQ
jgi:hypothetical protein